MCQQTKWQTRSGGRYASDKQYLTNMTLSNIALWAMVQEIDLVNVSPRLPFDQLEEHCPRLQTLQVTLFATDTIQTLTSRLSFIESLTTLERLSLTIHTGSKIDPNSVFDTFRPSRIFLRKLHLQTISCVSKSEKTGACCLNKARIREVDTWQKLYDLKLEIRFENLFELSVFAAEDLRVPSEC